MANLNDFKKFGISFAGSRGFMKYSAINKKANAGSRYVLDIQGTKKQMAMDAATVTAPSVAFPVQLFNRIDPNVIDILFSVLNATQLLPQRKEGDWTTDYATFIVSEDVGSVSGYSDFASAPTSDVNVTFPSRQSFRFQTSIQWGDLEVAKSEVGNVNLIAQKQRAAANIMARNENKIYLFGVKGIKNYGILNDPNLNTAISPINQPINGGGSQTKWVEKAKDPNAALYIFNDICELFSELSKKNGGLIDQNSNLVLGISNTMISYFTKTSMYGVNVPDLLQKSFPNLTVVTVPELSNTTSNKMIMIAPNVSGQDTGYCVFCEKFKAYPVVTAASSFNQKVAASSMGAVITQPSAIAIMDGI